MLCNICKSKIKKVFTTKVLQTHDVKYYECPKCNLIQTEKPYWLKEAYKRPINWEDTGIISRNLYYLTRILAIIYVFFDETKKFLDYAGGYGILTRLMRDKGLDCFWNDPYTTNFIAHGFEYKKDSEEKVELITAIETFEHFEKPIPEISKIFKLSDSILFSTAIAPTPTPKPEDWWYYGTKHGQHISFYRKDSLFSIARKFGLNFFTDETDLHLFTKRKLVPKILTESFYKHLLETLSSDELSTINQAYTQNISEIATMFQPKNKKGALVKRFADLLKIDLVFTNKQNEYWTIRENLNQKINKKLETIFKKNSEILQACFKDTVKNAELIFELYIKAKAKSRTFDDMLYIENLLDKKLIK